MKIFLLLIAAALIISSCASAPPESPEPVATVAIPAPVSAAVNTPIVEQPPVQAEAPVETPEPEIVPVAVTPVPETVPELPEPPEPPEPPVHIMGMGIVPHEKLIGFLLWHNAIVDVDFVHSLLNYYIEESSVEGINYDIAFAQMCLETGFLHYGGLVTADMNNFCGLGAIGPAETGLIFPDPRTGVRAHIQHLKAYATVEPLTLTLVDPRYYLVRHGSSPTIHGLAGTWAADTSYSDKIDRILERLYRFSF